MSTKLETYPAALLELIAKAESATRMIPPLFPLDTSVAVNPFLGQSGETLPLAAARLARVAGALVTAPRDSLAARIESGEIRDEDLAAAARNAGLTIEPAALLAAAQRPAPTVSALPTVADLAARASGIDWPAIVAERIGFWAAAHFDQGQALWQPARASGVYGAWQSFAMRDLTPEIHGLQGFAATVSDAPRSAWRALGQAAETLGLGPDHADTAFHRLLMDLGGWAQYARYLLWQADLKGTQDTSVSEMLAIRLTWEAALFTQYHDAIAAEWSDVLAAHAAPLAPDEDQVIDAVLQEAAERAAQRALAAGFAETAAASSDAPAAERPILQAAFCIDVRSEVFRRALESLDSGIETIGFAGFFGLAVSHRAVASDVAEARGPVLLNMGVQTQDHVATADDNELRYAARARRAWGRFRSAAVSSFAFVEATGPIYAGKLLRDALRRGTAQTAPAPTPVATGLDLGARTDAAEKILRAMSLTRDFARIVLLAGHGSHVTNNAHASALQCGACGGHAGDVNARLLAGLLNDTEVRDGLVARGIAVPQDTLFLAALHDTASDQITLYTADPGAGTRTDDVAQVRRWLAQAGRLARAERAHRLPRAAGQADLLRRGLDWAELRPEWGLAGCQAFVAAPRGRTAGRSLEGRCFLHSYDWRGDDGFGVLELILTAPVVVASWISLQYYGSVVAPDSFGGGNKLLHNVTGGIGVVEGNGGLLRAGLPGQSVHDGERTMHDPLRLTVVIEAPVAAITDILARHDQVRALFDNGWLHLVALDDSGQMRARYTGDLTWDGAPLSGTTPIAAE
ncbi:MAG: DUF2309 domain-containing protein [Rhodobacteraceae bacterium]|nr:DUF2309 domain-containing protein [Paracoccaceae bacterium]